MRSFVKLFLFAFCAVGVTASMAAPKQFTLASPDGKIKVNVSVDKTIGYSVFHASDLLLDYTPISLTLSDGRVFGIDSRLGRVKTRSVNQVIEPLFYKKQVITDRFNELTLPFREGFSVVFRAYDDGMAYRFVYEGEVPITVTSENVEFRFSTDGPAYVPYVRGRKEGFDNQFFNSFENVYAVHPISGWDKERLAFLPLVAEGANGKKICITEADLINYPGMYLHNGSGTTTLNGVFAGYPKEIEQGGHNMLQGIVQSREDYIARFDGPAEMPWRVVIIAEEDKELADNDMIYKLASPSRAQDTSWIKPGKVAWDWWNGWNLYDVDFEAGINNETYRHYIDFASDNGIEYVILDEGWAVNLQADLYQVVPEIDLPELIDYANDQNVGLILWAGYYALNRDIEGICKHYAEMGIKGFKVDFMDRDDQPMVDFHYKVAEAGLRHKLLIDFHGTYKPTGLHRTFPNVINYEGVFGLEQMKWAATDVDMVTYDVTVPFIRMVAGPMDYTQGAMRNAVKSNYRPVYTEAMSQGTRCRQLAQYVVFESPLNMLCDSPSNYRREPECTEFIAGIPTVWDSTVVLDGKIGEYIAIARQSGGDWYVGGMTNWDAREMELDLSFLGVGSYVAEIYQDGVNAHRAARDYKIKRLHLTPTGRRLRIEMAPGGGFAIKIKPAHR